MDDSYAPPLGSAICPYCATVRERVQGRDAEPMVVRYHCRACPGRWYETSMGDYIMRSWREASAETVGPAPR
jgi:hypothetical protein